MAAARKRIDRVAQRDRTSRDEDNSSTLRARAGLRDREADPR